MINFLLVLERHPVFTGFIPSFQEASEELKLNMKVFIVDEDKSYQKQRVELKKCILEYKIDRLLSINAFIRGNDILINEEISSLVSCYAWFVDSIKFLKSEIFNLKYYKGISSFEPEDLKYASTHHLAIKYVPLTAGNKIFRKKFAFRKKYDISFVGLVAGSSKRLKILNAVAYHCKKYGYKMICYGHFWHNSYFLKNVIGAFLFKRKYPALYPYVINRRITPDECAGLYRETRINLNIHVEHHTGFNCRTFEILEGGNFELTDEQSGLNPPFKNKQDLVFYHNIDELLQSIDYYLNHKREREDIAQTGQLFVDLNYKFVDSLHKVLYL